MDHGLRPEYDFAQMQSGVGGKYADRYQAVINLVLLDPDVAQSLPKALSQLMMPCVY